MRKITLFFTTCLMAILLMGGGFLQAQTVYPYLPQQLNDFEGDAIAAVCCVPKSDPVPKEAVEDL